MILRLKAPRPARLLLVTFDLFNTTPGDPRYAQADAALKFHGPVFRPVKQLRLLITNSTSARVRQSVEQRIGRQTTIFIAPIKSIPAWRIHTAKKQREWRNFVDALKEYKIEIDYVASTTENAA